MKNISVSESPPFSSSMDRAEKSSVTSTSASSKKEKRSTKMVTMFLECWTCKLGQRARLFVLITGVFLYLVFGAVVFSALEESNEKERIAELRQLRAAFAAKVNGSVTEQELEEFIKQIVDASQSGVPATNNVTFPSSWSFGQSFFFVGTLVTTIGYGHTLPLSYPGKIFAICYGLIGVPLTLIMFSAIASRILHLLGSLLTKLKLKLSYINNELYVRLIHLSLVSLVLVPLFIFIPAAIFTVLEDDWNYLDSLYYCFISLTTIGLGDYIPGEDYSQTYRAVYKIAVTFYLFLGLISVMTTIGVICNIKELNLTNYFTLDEEVKEDEERLNIHDLDSAPRTYTEEGDKTANK